MVDNQGLDIDFDNEKLNYAKIFKPELTPLTLTDLTYFPIDYIMRCVEGDYQGRQIRMRCLGNEFYIGSSDKCELSIQYSSLDEQHCKLKYIENTIYFTLEDCKSKKGTWKKIHPFDDSLELTNDKTEFFMFNHIFVVEKKDSFFLLYFTQTTDKHKSEKYELKENDVISIGKSNCIINLEDIKCSEDHKYELINKNGRVFVINKTEEITNEGLFYRLDENEVGLLRAGDVFKIGYTSFRILTHNWGLTTELGDKSRQEDKYCILDDLRLFDEIIIPTYAVYDGHAGPSCSIYLQKYFHKNIRDICKLKNLKNSKNFFLDFFNAVQDAIIYTDLAFQNTSFGPNQGSTCVMLFFIANKVICCNLGDSVAILHKKDDSKVFLSKDFKPSRNREKERVKAKNGFVSNEGRLLGLISVTRGFGDWRFKDPKRPENIKKMEVLVTYDEYLMSNRAEFRIFEIDPTTCDYIIVVSDGIFQHTSYKMVFDIINNCIKTEKSDSESGLVNVSSASDNVRLEIINRSYMVKTNRKSAADNMTLILIHLNNDNK